MADRMQDFWSLMGDAMQEAGAPQAAAQQGYSIFDLPADEFRGALAELGYRGEDFNDMVRRYRDYNLPSLAAPDEGMRRLNIVPAQIPQGMGLFDAIASGQAEFAVPGMIAGATDATARGLTAPEAAYLGLIPQGDMADEAANLGGMLQLGGVASAGRAAFDYDPTVAMAGGFQHPSSRVRYATPVEEIPFQVTETGLAVPQQYVDIADLQGQVLVPAFGDRTRAGGLLTRIGDEELMNPVELQGGADFMRSGWGAWASEPDAMQTKARHIARIADEYGVDPIMVYTAMGAQAGDFSRMMSDAMMQQIRPSMHNYVHPEAVQRFDAYVRENIDPDWSGILSPDAPREINQMTGSNRRLLWQEMDRRGYMDDGFPSVGNTRVAITDPRLLNADPFQSGLTMSRLNQGFDTVPTPEAAHATYGSMLPGEYIGGLLEQVPGEMMWRDWFAARRAAGARTSSDQRSFMMSPNNRQLVDQQLVDTISQYLEERAR